ncbi:MAG: aromatic ring-hydroxylating dioxygenase subunit alpha [Proteobacteria bacterium]|nr:aromatic ring-hydroxylating dioxygenase subunit alpha [Pseudomonadota bacterium]
MTQRTAETLSAALYRDPAVYEEERKLVFAKSWILFAHESQLSKPGAYVASRMAGFALLAVKGEDGAVRAFHNVCRHRAGPLVDDGAGDCGNALLCRYHGWRYALDGRLASARDFGPASDFDPRDFGLIPLQCAMWHGFVFVNMDRNASDFEQTIAPLEKKASAMALERFTRVRHSEHLLKCNWKTYVENYLEGYHIPVLHPALNASLGSTYGVEIDPPVQFYHATPREGSAVAGLWAWQWPCLGVNVYADGVLMERMWPVDHGHTKLDYLFLFAEDADEASIRRAVAASEVTTAEDILICEAVQQNLNAGVYEKGRLSPKHEAGVAWFQTQIRRALDR